MQRSIIRSKCADPPSIQKKGRTQFDHHCLNGHRSALVWFTGLSGSGKSILAHALEEHLFDRGINSHVLDGDNIRHGLKNDLRLSPKDRKKIRRIVEAAKIMADSGLVSFPLPHTNSGRVVVSGSSLTAYDQMPTLELQAPGTQSPTIHKSRCDPGPTIQFSATE